MLKYNLIDKSGSWYSYNGERIGQGRDNAIQYLIDNKNIYSEIELLIKKKFDLLPDDKNNNEDKKRISSQNNVNKNTQKISRGNK